MTGAMTAPPSVLIEYDTTGYPQLPPSAPPPRVMRPAGSGTPGKRRARPGIRAVAGAVVVLLVAAGAVRCSGIGPTESPESLVRSLFAALTAHDGQRVKELAWCDGSPLCSAEGLGSGYQAPEDFDIVSTDRGDDHRVFKVRFTVGGAAAEDTVGVTRYRAGMLGHRWMITRMPGARLDLRTAASDQLHVAGITAPASPVDDFTAKSRPKLFAPPGAYTVTVDADALFATTTVTVLVAAGQDPAPTIITPTLRPDLQALIEQQVRDRITSCAAQHEFHPYTPQWRKFQETCPFQDDPPSPIAKPPTWTIERLPKITLTVNEQAIISVRTTQPGIAVMRYQWSVDILEPRRWTDASNAVEFTVTGKVTVKENVPYWIG